MADVRVAAGLLDRPVVVVEGSFQEGHPVLEQQNLVVALVGGAALDEAHADGGVFGQPRGEHAAGGAAADDHIVVARPVLGRGLAHGVLADGDGGRQLGMGSEMFCNSVKSSTVCRPPTRPVPLAVPAAPPAGSWLSQ